MVCRCGGRIVVRLQATPTALEFRVDPFSAARHADCLAGPNGGGEPLSEVA